MPTSIFLLGTDHKYQCGGRDCSIEQSRAFSDYIRKTCHSHSIKRIAEEMSSDGRINYEVEETIASCIARDLKIQHHDIDLSKREREALSLTISAVINAKSAFKSRDGGGKLRGKFDVLTDQVRERIWAARIMNANSWPVLVILGSDHIEPFHKVWRKLGGNAEILCTDYIP